MNGFSVTSDFLCAPTSEPTLNLSVCAGTSQVPAFLSPAAAMTFPKKHKKKKDRKSLPEADVAVSVLGVFFYYSYFSDVWRHSTRRDGVIPIPATGPAYDISEWRDDIIPDLYGLSVACVMSQ